MPARGSSWTTAAAERYASELRRVASEHADVLGAKGEAASAKRMAEGLESMIAAMQYLPHSLALPFEVVKGAESILPSGFLSKRKE